MAFWRSFRDYIVGILFLALLLGTIGAPIAQLYYALQNLKLLHSDQSLHSRPLGYSIWYSERLSVDGAILGVVGAGLLWLSAIVAGNDRGSQAARNRRQKVCELGFLPLCGIICIIATAIELSSVKLKTKYLPLLSNTCRGSTTWPVYIDGRHSFWNIADAWFAERMYGSPKPVSSSGGDAEPISDRLACYNYLLEYRIQVIATTCILVLGLGLIGTVMLDLSDRFHRHTIPSRIGYNFTSVLGVICILSVAGPIFLIFEFLEKIAPWTRYHRAYAAKICGRSISRLRLMLHTNGEAMTGTGSWVVDHGSGATRLHLRRRSPDVEMAMRAKETTTSQPLMSICKYDLAVALSTQMHYVDIVSLSQTCRAWRDCIFPPNVCLVEQQERFKNYTCGTTDRQECWSCKNAVCDYCCDRQHKVSQDFTGHHISRCVPYCKVCFRSLMRSGVRRRGCQTYRDRSKEIKICTNCKREPRQVFNSNGTRKWKSRIQQSNLEQQACDKCSEPLEKKGPQFWVCKKEGCEHECRSSVHPSWIVVDEAKCPTTTIKPEARDEDAVSPNQDDDQHS